MDEVPEDRCGKEMEINVRNTLKFDHYCCFRPVWKDTGKCIWHADVEGKPQKELRKMKLQRGERLDETILRGVSCPNFDFSDSTLIKAEITNSTIRGNFENCILHDIEISNSDLSSSYFESADLTDASFTNSIFVDCDFSGVYLSIVEFLESSFLGSIFNDSRIEDAEFKESDFRGVDFNNSTISGVEFSGLDLHGASFNDTFLVGSSFDNAVVRDGRFRNSILRSADFRDSELGNVDFTDADGRAAAFDGANLEDATFDGTELRDANLRNTRLYQTLFSDIRINSNTDFGEKSAYENPETELGESYEDTSRWEAAAWVYRRLQDLHEENAMSEKAREYHVRKEEAHRSDYWEKGQYFQWFIYTLNLALTNHGESVKRVVYWSIGVILACALAYPFTGGIATGSEVFRATSLSALSLGLILRSLYFSTVTFTTLGYGDYHPVGEWSKALAGAESLAGALLVALFVFVLGRRVAR